MAQLAGIGFRSATRCVGRIELSLFRRVLRRDELKMEARTKDRREDRSG